MRRFLLFTKGKGARTVPRYVQTDEEMRRELLESGIAGAIFDPQDGRQIEGATLDRLCKTLSQIEDSILALERRGISLREHAARQDKTTARLPYYHVFWKNQEHWFLTRRELDEFVSRIESETGSSLEKPVGHDSLDAALTGRDQPPSEGGEDIGDRDLHITELHEVRSLNRQLVDLREIGFEIDALIPEKHTGLEGSRYYLRKGDTETGIDDLRGLLTAIRQSGERLSYHSLQRLGEMDPEELRETTLDPKNRSLVQITMEDASAADDIFRILMGDRVRPRREFIEQNASGEKPGCLTITPRSGYSLPVLTDFLERISVPTGKYPRWQSQARVLRREPYGSTLRYRYGPRTARRLCQSR